jgi:hypothetical protein
MENGDLRKEAKLRRLRFLPHSRERKTHSKYIKKRPLPNGGMIQGILVTKEY